MAIRPVLKMGEPLLLQVAEPVQQFDTHELHTLIADMLDTMKAHNGAGIAAPQVGVSQQVVIFGGLKSPRYPESRLRCWSIPY
jgi:peptide deformylase